MIQRMDLYREWTDTENEPVQFLYSNDNKPAIQQRQAVTFKMDSDIQKFIQHYSWAFPLNKPVGKLSAYFAKIIDSGL